MLAAPLQPDDATTEYRRGLALWCEAAAPGVLAQIDELDSQIDALVEAREALAQKLPLPKGSALSILPYVYVSLEQEGLAPTQAAATVRAQEWNVRMKAANSVTASMETP